MRIGVLTSSRADYGIYLPLLRLIQADSFFDLRLIVFGTHLSHFHGHTIEQIVNDGFNIDYKVENLLVGDSAEAIATSMALTQMKFSKIWELERDNYKVVFCLGDRYEMFAAVCAGIPFGIRFAHIHGGETTLGAIDNQFRHSLSLFSQIHFVATEKYAQRVEQIIGQDKDIYNVGALSLDNLEDISLCTLEEFKREFDVDLSVPTILFTFHPETVSCEENIGYSKTIIEALKQLDMQTIITMPNADQMGNSMRKIYEQFAREKRNVFCIETLGTRGYFTCMKYANILIGNSSSGIIEAASFQRYFVNIGRRQDGRLTSGNVLNVPINVIDILAACHKVKDLGLFRGRNVYYNGGARLEIIKVIKMESDGK